MRTGKWGTCSWTLDDDGVLTINEGTGLETFSTRWNIPWKAYGRRHEDLRPLIREIHTVGKIICPETCTCLFDWCFNLVKADLSGFDTSRTHDLSWLLGHCHSLQEVNCSSFNTDRVINMACMFYEDESLEYVDISSWNTRYVWKMGGMFYGCTNLRHLKYDAARVDYNDEKYASFVEGCRNLEVSGKWGTCDWMIGRDGILTITEGTGSDCRSLDETQYHPWDLFHNKITGIQTVGLVKFAS